MGILSPTNTELQFHSMMFAEALHLQGDQCMLYQLEGKSDYVVEKDYANDPKPKYIDPVIIDVLLDTNPQAKLRKMNWLAESDDLPILAYVSNHAYRKPNDYEEIVVTQYCIIELPYSLRDLGTQKFIVTDVRSEGLHPLYWTCKLAPVRDQVDLDPSTPEVDSTLPASDSGTNYLNFKY